MTRPTTDQLRQWLHRCPLGRMTAHLEPVPDSSLKLEYESDKLLRSHGCAHLTGQKTRREYSLSDSTIETIIAANGGQVSLPPEVVSRILSRALKASASPRNARIWALSYLGLTNRSIAELADLHEVTVCNIVRRVQLQIRAHFDNGDWWTAYLETLRWLEPPSPTRHPWLGEEVEAARAKIEERTGWETWVLKDDMRDRAWRVRVVYGYHIVEGRLVDRHWILSQKQIIRLALTGQVKVAQNRTVIKI